MRDIIGFFGPFRFLSNFYHSPIAIDGYIWPTVEHYFQWCKADTDQDYWAELILKRDKPSWAKHIGRWKIPLRSDWEEIKDDVMHCAIHFKFQNCDLADRLIATAPGRLVEENNWGDQYWGRCNGVGRNQLGLTLMWKRDQLIRCRSF